MRGIRSTSDEGYLNADDMRRSYEVTSSRTRVRTKTK
jgi:hypothetical protein